MENETNASLSWIPDNRMYNVQISHNDGWESTSSEDLSIDELNDLLGKLITEDPQLLSFRRLFRANELVPQKLIPLLLLECDPRVQKLEKFYLALRLITNLTLPGECLSQEALSNPYCRAEIEHLLKDLRTQLLSSGLLAHLIRQTLWWIKILFIPLELSVTNFLHQFLLLCRNILSIKDDPFNTSPNALGRSTAGSEMSRLVTVLNHRASSICTKRVIEDFISAGLLDLLLTLCSPSMVAHQPAWSSVIAQLLVLFCKDYSPTELAGRIRSQNTVHIKRHEDDDEQYIDSSSVKHLKLISSGKPDAYTTGLSHNTVTTDVSRAVVPVTKMYQQLPDSQLTSTDILQQTPVDALARLIVNLLVSGSHGRLLLGLKEQLQMDGKFMDLSYFLWLFAYFSKFIGTDGPLRLEQFRVPFSPEAVSFLVYVAVDTWEKIHTESDPQRVGLAKRLQMVLKSVQDLFALLERLSGHGATTSPENCTLQHIQGDLWNMTDLRCMTFLFLSQYHPDIEPHALLEEFLLTNYSTLKLLSRVGFAHGGCVVQFVENHLSPEIVRACNYVLEKLSINRRTVNDALLFLLSISVKILHRSSLLFKTELLMTVSELLNASDRDHLTQDWMSLLHDINNGYASLSHMDISAATDCIGSHESRSNAERSYDSKDWKSEHSGRAGHAHSLNSAWEAESRTSMMDPEASYEANYFKHPPENQNSLSAPEETYLRSLANRRIRLLNNLSKKSVDDLVILLTDRGHRQHLHWLQRQLLDICATKFFKEKYPCTGLVLHYIRTNQPIPLFAYTPAQQSITNNPTFQALLHRLGIELADKSKVFFHRIPAFWSSSFLLYTAQLLAPLPPPEELLFDPALINDGETHW